MKEDRKCIKCGEYEKAIRKNGIICGEVDSFSGELVCEYGRHRFKPYTGKELGDFSDAYSFDLSV